jgi:hypothetical protein
MIVNLIVINVTAAIFGGFIGWWLRGKPAASRDDRSERIMEHMASWVAILRDRPNDRMAQKIADDMLFSAACVHYAKRTDAMDSGTASRWIRARVEEMVAEAAASHHA